MLAHTLSYMASILLYPSCYGGMSKWMKVCSQVLEYKHYIQRHFGIFISGVWRGVLRIGVGDLFHTMLVVECFLISFTFCNLFP